MPQTSGPYGMLDLGSGLAPWFMLPFDERGSCTAPQLLTTLSECAAGGSFTDVILFSHGWNTTWAYATASYRRFMHNFSEVRKSVENSPGAFRPLLVGIFWPSIGFVLPWEESPLVASSETDDLSREEYLHAVHELAADLAPAGRPRFYELISTTTPLTRAQAAELGDLLLPIYQGDGIEFSVPQAESAEDLCAAWFAAAAQSPETDTSGSFGFAMDAASGPAAAGHLDYLDPRWPLRLASVWQMKDRAGRVGSYGVGPVLRDLLISAPTARVHLAGHSFGCKVVLSALCHQQLPRQVESALLLQPAISAYCFAADAAGPGRPGGYCQAPSRVRSHIMLTFSHRDRPLHRFFHLAVRRKSDIGEVNTAAGAVSPYAALGGYGPQGLKPEEARVEPMRKPEEGSYLLGGNNPKIVALNGGALVKSHGDYVTVATAFALSNLVLLRV